MVKAVGYGSPPNHTKWQKGQSGNPKGRKKGSVNFKTDLLDELSEVIQVTESGKPIRITKQRALLKALLMKGLKGDVRAASLMMTLLKRHDLAEPVDVEADLTTEETAALENLLDRRAAQRRNQNEGEDK